MSGFWFVSYVLLWVLVLLQVFVTLILIRALRQQGQVPQSVESPATGPLIGQRAPELELVDARSGATLSSTQFHGRPLLIAFVDAVCPSCHRLAPKLEEFYIRNQAEFQVIVVCRSGAASTSAFISATNLNTVPVFLDPAGDVALAFNVNISPFVLFLDSQGIVRDKLTGSQIGDFDYRVSAALNRIKRQA
jgi:peroxiredoxin